MKTNIPFWPYLAPYFRMGDVSDSVANGGHGLIPSTVLSTIQVRQNRFWHSLFCIKICRVTLILWLFSVSKKGEEGWKPVQITGP